MEIPDILSSAAKALRYSTRSKGKFLLSLVGAILVLAVGYTALYDFLYPRIFNVEHSRYGVVFWAGFLLVAVVLPLGNGVAAILKVRAQSRPFPQGKFGIVIAPFEAMSLDPETLGTPASLEGLGRVAGQYFTSAERTLKAEDWSEDFAFRLLPESERIVSSKQAEAVRTRMSATLIIWGEVVQAANQPLTVVMHFRGPKVDLALSGAFVVTLITDMLRFLTLIAAAFSVQERRLLPATHEMFLLAREAAARLDRSSKAPGKHVDMVDRFIAELEAAQ